MSEIINTLIGLSVVTGLLLGIIFTLFYVWLWRDAEQRRKARLHLLCPECRKTAKRFKM